MVDDFIEIIKLLLVYKILIVVKNTIKKKDEQ